MKFRTLQKAKYISVLSSLTSSGIRRIVLHILIVVSEKPAAPISSIHNVLVHIYWPIRCHIQKTVVLILNTKSSTVHTGLLPFDSFSLDPSIVSTHLRNSIICAL